MRCSLQKSLLARPETLCCLLAPLFAFQLAAAQGSMSVTTDKPSYEYGDVIEIRVRIWNPTQEPFELTGSSSCQAQFLFDDFNSVRHTKCTADSIIITFQPGSERTWIWRVDPMELGLPTSTGDHVIVGHYGAMTDSIIVNAPQFLGGRVGIGLDPGVPADAVDAVRDSLNAQVLDSFEGPSGISEVWQVSGVPIDTAAAVFSRDARFRYFETLREIQYHKVVSTDDEIPPAAQTIELSRAYPNPFTTSFTVELKLESTQHIRVVIHDLLGRQVQVVHDGVLLEGVLHRIRVDAGSLTAGTYVYRVVGASTSASGTAVLNGR